MPGPSASAAEDFRVVAPGRGRARSAGPRTPARRGCRIGRARRRPTRRGAARAPRTATGAGRARGRRPRRGPPARRDAASRRPCAPDAAPAASFDPTSSTSPSPTSQSVPSGNTARNVATIDCRSRGADVVGVRPLAQHAARRQAVARGLEELAREERGDAGHPRVRRLGDDDVVALAGEQQVRSPVADDEARARVGQRAMILVVEEARGFDDFAARSRARSARSTGCVSAEPSVTPLPRPRIATRLGVRDGAAAARARAAAASACRRSSTRPPCRRWPATSCRPPGARRRCRWGLRRNRAVRRRCSPVARSGAAQRRGVLVAAARQEQPIPVGQRRRPGRRRRRPAAAARGGARPLDAAGDQQAQRADAPRHRHEPDGPVQAEPGDQDEPGEQRAGDGAGGVDRVDQAQVGRHRFVAARRHGDGKGKRGAEGNGHRRQQRRRRAAPAGTGPRRMSTSGCATTPAIDSSARSTNAAASARAADRERETDGEADHAVAARAAPAARRWPRRWRDRR